MEKETVTTKAGHSLRKNKTIVKGHCDGADDPLPGRRPSAAFMSALDAVGRTRGRKRK